MIPDKSILLEQIDSAIKNKSCSGNNGAAGLIAPKDYTSITTELNDRNNLHLKNNELIRSLEQRIEALESQNDRLLYFIHFLYDNFPDMVRNIVPPINPDKEEQPLSRNDDEKNVYPHLTRREEEILNLMVKGLCAKEIARMLFISETTVITHKKNLKEKFSARNSVELISKALGMR